MRLAFLVFLIIIELVVRHTRAYRPITTRCSTLTVVEIKLEDATIAVHVRIATDTTMRDCGRRGCDLRGER